MGIMRFFIGFDGAWLVYPMVLMRNHPTAAIHEHQFLIISHGWHHWVCHLGGAGIGAGIGAGDDVGDQEYGEDDHG